MILSGVEWSAGEIPNRYDKMSFRGVLESVVEFVK